MSEKIIVPRHGEKITVNDDQSLTVPDHPMNERQHRTLIAPEQLAVGRLAPLEGEFDDRLVGEFGVVHRSMLSGLRLRGRAGFTLA